MERLEFWRAVANDVAARQAQRGIQYASGIIERAARAALSAALLQLGHSRHSADVKWRNAKESALDAMEVAFLDKP